MATQNTLAIRSSGGKSQMKIIPAPNYNPQPKALLRRDNIVLKLKKENQTYEKQTFNTY